MPRDVQCVGMAESEQGGQVLAHPFDRDTRVWPCDGIDGMYDAVVSDRWAGLGGDPNGGYLLVLCLRALALEMPFTNPLAVSAFYHRAATTGPAKISAQLVRAGKRVGTGQASLLQDDTERIRVVSTFTDLENVHGRTALFAEPPTLPDPHRCVDLLQGHSIKNATITDHIEYRVPVLPGWRRRRPSGSPQAELWMRLNDREPDLMTLPLLVDAAAPAVLELGARTSITLEMTVHLRANPAPGWLACRVRTQNVIDGFHDEDLEIWDSKGRLVAQSRQIALLVE